MADSLMFTDLSALKYLLLLPVIVLLYMVRSRYRRRNVSSIMLWRSVRRDLEARQRLRLPPLSILMLLQLLAIGAGTVALTRPALPAEDRTHLVILIDVSASMQSADVSPSRFEVAIHRARQAIQRIEPGDQVSLVQVGSAPSLVVSSSDITEVQAALDHLRPGTAYANAAAALELADTLINETGGQGLAYLLSDGAFGGPFYPPQISIPVEFAPIGSDGQNQGITAVDVRPDMDASGRWSAFARVTNHSDSEARLVAMATADDLLLDRMEITLGPGESSDLSFALPPETRAFGLNIETHDIFQGDDRVEVQLGMPKPRKVLLVSREAGPIERVLKTLPELSITTVLPESYQSAGGADLVILDGFIPQTLPDADLLILNPPVDSPGLVTQIVGAEAAVLRSRVGNPLIDSVDLQSLRLGQMVRLETPIWARAIVEGQQGPLILQGERSGRRIVIFNFDWMLFDLPRMQAFPLLLSNAIDQLNPTMLPGKVQPGNAVQLRPMADSTEAIVELPDGSRRSLTFNEGAISFGETQQVGRYTVKWKGARLGDVYSGFNVNVDSAAESDVTPQVHLLGRDRITRGYSPPVPGLQLWPFLALLLLAILSAEWSYFSRRG